MKKLPQSVANDSSEKLNYQLSLNEVELILVTLDAMNRLTDEPTLTQSQALALSTKFYRFDVVPIYPQLGTIFDRLYEPLFEYRFSRGLLQPDEDDMQVLCDSLLGSYAYTNADMTGFNHDN